MFSGIEKGAQGHLTSGYRGAMAILTQARVREPVVSTLAAPGADISAPGGSRSSNVPHKSGKIGMCKTI